MDSGGRNKDKNKIKVLVNSISCVFTAAEADLTEAVLDYLKKHPLRPPPPPPEDL